MSSVEGLTSHQAAAALQRYGRNEIPVEQRRGLLSKLAVWAISPIALMLTAAAALSALNAKLFDAGFIIALMALNFAIGAWQEHKADRAIEKLNAHLASRVKVRRDGQWRTLDSKQLVPGDVIELASGDVVPADGTLLQAAGLTVNESVLTGESLPKDKAAGDPAYSGSFLAMGIATVRVTATGRTTAFGKTILSVERVKKVSGLEQDILRISKFLSVLSLAAVAVLTAVFLVQRAPLGEILTLDLSLMIAGIPISLPTVMTLIIEFGVVGLARKHAIVRRLSALEDLANVSLLLTDKTGTLTKNEINVQAVRTYGQADETAVLRAALLSAAQNERSTINNAIAVRARALGVTIAGYTVLDFMPADSNRKRSTLTARGPDGSITVSLGAPQVVADRCRMPAAVRALFEHDVTDFGSRGFRSLAVALNNHGEKEEGMTLLGLIALSDTLQPDARAAIKFMRANGIQVAVITGDNRAVSAEVAKALGLKGAIMTHDELVKLSPEALTARMFRDTAVFAEVLPEDKLRLVQRALASGFVVAANGDGVNDIAAIKAAPVGIAVQHAVDALKAAADIVLLSPGIAVIRDAISESRKIFSRLSGYAMYRISESLRLIITIAILGFMTGAYPLTPLQLILLALLNDIPIISLATDRVRASTSPAKINVRERFTISSLFGLTGVANSLILFFVLTQAAHLSWPVIQTLYFLKLTVSGHMLIYVAHTRERWFKFLPSRAVIIATTVTQIIATSLAVSGFLMPAAVPLGWAAFVWLWAFGWMQVSELMKVAQKMPAVNLSH